MVGPNGQIERCQYTGQGIVGMATAGEAENACVRSLRGAGYLEIERAGKIGVTLTGSTRILKVELGSPADSAGIQAGDVITEIDGQSVDTDQQAQVLLFGVYGTTVSVTVSRDGTEQEHLLTRAPYVPPPKPKPSVSQFDY